MTEELKQDPELFDDDEHGVGDESAYDGEAAEFIEFDEEQFELDDDFEVEDDEDE